MRSYSLVFAGVNKLSSSWVNFHVLYIFEHHNTSHHGWSWNWEWVWRTSPLAYLYRWINGIGEDQGNSSFLELLTLFHHNSHCQENDCSNHAKPSCFVAAHPTVWWRLDIQWLATIACIALELQPANVGDRHGLCDECAWCWIPRTKHKAKQKF